MVQFSNSLFILRNASLAVLIRAGMTTDDLAALETQSLEPDPSLPPEISKRLIGAFYALVITWFDGVVYSMIFYEGFRKIF